jgi:hypothetical protein
MIQEDDFKGYHRLNLSIKLTDYAAACICYDKIRRLANSGLDIPASLIKEHFGYFNNLDPIRQKHDTRIMSKVKPVVKQIMEYFEQPKYQFNGIYFRKEWNLQPPKGEKIVKSKYYKLEEVYSFQSMLELCLYSYFTLEGQEQMKDKDNVIRFFFREMMTYRKILSRTDKKKIGRSKMALFAGYTTTCVGFTITKDKTPSFAKISDSTKNALKRSPKAKRGKSSK